MFLRHKGNDSDKLLNPLGKEGYVRMLERYRKVFAEFDKEPDREAEGRILQFKSYLGDSLNVLNKLAETCVKMQEVSKNSIEKKLSMI